MSPSGVMPARLACVDPIAEAAGTQENSPGTGEFDKRLSALEAAFAGTADAFPWIHPRLLLAREMMT